MSDRPTVLIAEDDTLVRTLLLRRFGMEPYDVVAAHDGRDAIAKLEASPYDLVITDIQMPHVDGVGVLKRAKALYGDEIAVLIMTGFATTTTAVEAVRAGAFDYLMKPFRQLDDLVRKAAQALEQLRLQRQNRTMMQTLKELNAKLRDVAAQRGAELAEAREELDALRGVVERSRAPEALSRGLLSGFERLWAIADQLKSDGHESADALRQEAETLCGIAARLLDSRRGE